MALFSRAARHLAGRGLAVWRADSILVRTAFDGKGRGLGDKSSSDRSDAGNIRKTKDFGKMEEAREEQYFQALNKEQIRRLKEHLDDEIAFHEREIKRHEDAIERHKRRRKRFSGPSFSTDDDKK